MQKMTLKIVFKAVFKGINGHIMLLIKDMRRSDPHYMEEIWKESG